MINPKEFYFVRHGQTDMNLRMVKTDHGDISINETGRKQALNMSSLVAKLPLQTICCSPFKRAKETKELLLPGRAHLEMADLGECTAEVWMGLTALQKEALQKGSPAVRTFLERVKTGLNQALECPGPVLIVAHGGVHWAICYWMEIEGHSWMIDNCQPVHFSLVQSKWSAKILA